MKIVVLDGFTLNPGDLSWDELRLFGELTVYDRSSVDQVIERASDCEVLFTNKVPLSSETVKALPSVKYVGVLATGYNVVDVKAAKDRGIVVTNIPTYGTRAVAQMVFAHLLEICHHVWDHNLEVKNGAWGQSGDFCFWNYPLIELADKLMGIVGYGRIGQATARIARAFGMKVLVVEPNTANTQKIEGVSFVELDELFRQSDIISLHCPLTEGTEGIINRENISKMKDGVILINTSRGQLVVERDLTDALNSGKIAAAGLDVLQVEPPDGSSPVFRAKNCIITPHIAWAPKEARTRLMDVAIENLRSFLEGKPVNVVS